MRLRASWTDTVHDGPNTGCQKTLWVSSWQQSSRQRIRRGIHSDLRHLYKIQIVSHHDELGHWYNAEMCGVGRLTGILDLKY
jgi:hypothetical protein